MLNQLSLDEIENRQKTNETDITKFEDPTQDDPHQPLIPVDNQHTIT
jgi:hypothetical protein